MAPGDFLGVDRTVVSYLTNLGRPRTGVLELSTFPGTGPMAIVVNAMAYVSLGILGFMVGYSTELAAINKLGALKPAVWVASFGLLGYAMVMVCLNTSRFILPGWLSFVGWGLLPLFSLLMLYTLVLELPFRRTFVGNASSTDLVTTGTYALIRHPTVLWYLLILASMLLATRSYVLLVAMPIWIAMDVGWVLLQEKSSLARNFPDYGTYQRCTPFLIPNRRSLTEFLRSFRRAGRIEADVSRR